jgi:lactoylglutathione lyase
LESADRASDRASRKGDVSMLRVDHVALWVSDLERMREFYVSVLGATSGSLYENSRTGLRSYFLSFPDGGRVEVMSRSPGGEARLAEPGLGYAHLALSVGSRPGVDETVERLRCLGVKVLGEPRVTGDGYYEAVVEDPEGNRIEIVG